MITRGQIDCAAARLTVAQNLLNMLLELFERVASDELKDRLSGESRKAFRQVWLVARDGLNSLLSDPLSIPATKEYSQSDAAVASVRAREALELLAVYDRTLAHVRTIGDDDPITGTAHTWTDKEWGTAEAKVANAIAALKAKLAEIP